ncbi:Copper resistance protein B precursor [Luteitalea pratensis]|uniref:Copper resistance protein B n=1 Tax=Luteitalea pratensis TaxID=1855912 RepID=A0A143PLZ6_LUTPR|nr:Copper resistance protein B precursor [Luteitalea pratensis]
MTVARPLAAMSLCLVLAGIARAQDQDHRSSGSQEHKAETAGQDRRNSGGQELRSAGAQERRKHTAEADDDRPAPRGHIESAPPPASVIVPPWIPDVSDEMRRAAFPDVQGHAAHDQRINGFVLFDQLEWRAGNGPGSLSWSNTGWVGGDINRVWFRTEGDGVGSGMDAARVHLLYGRAVARWWNVVAGVRQDLQPGAQTWLAVGVQGLAPGFFDVEATAYLSDEGQTAAHVEVGYDVLITNRWVLQPVMEMDVYGKPNASIGVGSGLSTGEAGIRLRYQFTREFAPYVGVSWLRAFGGTADLDHDADVPNGAPRLVTGVRVWF